MLSQLCFARRDWNAFQHQDLENYTEMHYFTSISAFKTVDKCIAETSRGPDSDQSLSLQVRRQFTVQPRKSQHEESHWTGQGALQASLQGDWGSSQRQQHTMDGFRPFRPIRVTLQHPPHVLSLKKHEVRRVLRPGLHSKQVHGGSHHSAPNYREHQVSYVKILVIEYNQPWQISQQIGWPPSPYLDKGPSRKQTTNCQT